MVSVWMATRPIIKIKNVKEACPKSIIPLATISKPETNISKADHRGILRCLICANPAKAFKTPYKPTRKHEMNKIGFSIFLP
jgi:hypothetical protein